MVNTIEEYKNEELRSNALLLLSKEYYVDKAISKRKNSIVFFICAFLSTTMLNGELEPFSELVEIYSFYRCVVDYMESMLETKKMCGEIIVPLPTLLKLKAKILKYKEFFKNEELYKKYFNEISGDNLISINFDGEIENVKNISYLKLRKITKMIKENSI